MGLTLKGKPVVWSNRPCPSVLQSRYQLIDNKSPTLEGLERLVKHEIEANNMDGSLRAFYAYTLECLIFSRRRAIETSHWHLLDNLEEIGNYAWGVAAYEYLRKSLLNISKDDISERRLDGCSYMLKILVLERGHAPLMVGEEARKVPRIGRWTVSRMSKCKAEELLNCEPEKVIERLKIDDWEVDFVADMGVINENVVDEKKELSAPPPVVIQNDDSIVTVMKRRVDELEAEVDCGKRKLEWAREVYGVDWSLYPENVDRSTGGNEMSVEVAREEYDDVGQDYVMSEMEESPGIPGRVKIDHRTRKTSFKVLSAYERTVVARKSSRNVNNAVIFEEWVVMHQSYKLSDKEIERLKRLEKKLLMDDRGLSIEV